MATNTPSLGLVLLGIGESAGTWGIPLNNNFSKIDILAGEIISARGSEADLNTRFSTIESEVGSARGVLPTLNDRLSVLLGTDGNININNFPKSTQTNLGATRLSVAAVDPAQPIAVGTNDTRLLTTGQKGELTGGGITSLHTHTLDAAISDVTATAAEINQAIDGISANVTAGNLNILTGGGIVPKTLMTIPVGGYLYDGIVRLSATPSVASEPIAVGTNDTRMMTQIQKDALVTGNVTALHRHNLVDGAADVTLSATALNQLTGMGAGVTASNLDALVGGGETSLHSHTNVHYTKAEVDTANTANNTFATAAIATHSANNSAHTNGNLNLGDITAKSINQTVAGVSHTIRSNASDVDSQIKFEVKDRSGISKVYVTTNGEIVADKITTRVHEVIETTTLTQDAVATSNLQVNGNTILGNDNAVDVFTANVSLATFNGDVDISGTNGLTVGGTINGVDLTVLNTDLNNVEAEILAARQGEASLSAKITLVETGSDAVAAEVQGARGGQASLDARIDIIESTAASFAANTSNPNNVTITQAIAADGGTGITTAELETLTDGSNADVLHTHTKYDTVLADSLTSSVYGTFGTLAGRMDAADALLNGHNTEIINARQGEASLDARLDQMDTDLLTALSLLPGKYVEAFASATTFSVVHGLNTKAVTVQLRDTATDIMLPDSAITSITMTDLDTVDIVVGVATAVEVVVIG